MLYPDIESYHTGFVDVTHNHKMYFELAGNPNGTPVLFVHGGPGAGLSTNFARFFDPNLFHIIGCDQRGCGRSTPTNDLVNNTTQNLLDDLSTLRKHLKINKWIIFGGSWGATLGLLLAIKEPQHTLAVILRGVFLARQQDMQWFVEPNGGAAKLFPDHYAEFIKPVGKTSSLSALCERFMAKFQSDNELQRTAAIRAWYQWEERISCLNIPSHYSCVNNTPLKAMVNMAMLECYYLANNCFIEENYILSNIPVIAHIPSIIVHGRYDSICNVGQAYELHQAWDNSTLNIIPAAGHSASEPGISSALCQASRQIAKFLKEKP